MFIDRDLNKIPKESKKNFKSLILYVPPGGNSNTPNLRFSEFGGKWKLRKIKSLGIFIGGGTPNTSNKSYWSGQIPWISSSDISENNIHEISKTKFITKEAITESATKIIPKGAVLIVSRVGIGKFAVADEDICTSQDFTNLITNENEYFIGYYFSARPRRFIKLSQGTSIKGFTSKDIRSANFFIPPNIEQKKIASFLSLIDERIRKQIKIIEDNKLLKVGVMQIIFKQKVRFKDKQGNQYPNWEEKKLGNICDCLDNRRKPLNESEREIMKGNIPYWGANNIVGYVNEYLFNETIVLLAEDGGYFNEFRTRPIAQISHGKCWVNNHAHVLRAKENDTSNLFLFYSFVHKNITGYVNGGTRAKLNKRDMLLIKVQLPCKEEQQKIASVLSAIDQKIELETKLLEQFKAQKQYFLQNLFI